MNWRRIVAIILGIAAILSLLSQLGIFSAAGLSEYPWWLIWPLTISGLIGALMLWFLSGERSSESSASDSAPAQSSGASSDLADRDARIARLEAQLAEAQMASQDGGGDSAALASENASLRAENARLKDEIGETAATMHATERVEFRGKSQDDLNTMFGGDFIDGAMARHFAIDYVDSKGQPSQREILVYALVHRKGNLNLDSFPTDGYSCLTFRADRIQKLKDLQTGDVVTQDIGNWIAETSKARAAD
ncbi:MAG: hypothetical protein CBC49_008510 [Alphaproteobacteria bacterium TMED89]|nr:hypothetical protein [Rhodospirillaceae bacterium]RPH12287.1 MAG: hypothetical protein CBC49_008510 [Alphaproteobacteria bacterium TMED89]